MSDSKLFNWVEIVRFCEQEGKFWILLNTVRGLRVKNIENPPIYILFVLHVSGMINSVPVQSDGCVGLFLITSHLTLITDLQSLI